MVRGRPSRSRQIFSSRLLRYRKSRQRALRAQLGSRIRSSVPCRPCAAAAEAANCLAEPSERSVPKEASSGGSVPQDVCGRARRALPGTSGAWCRVQRCSGATAWWGMRPIASGPSPRASGAGVGVRIGAASTVLALRQARVGRPHVSHLTCVSCCRASHALEYWLQSECCF